MLPDELLRDTTLFWDARRGSVEPEAHAPYVIGRVLSLGTLAQARAVERHYGRERLRSFFLGGGLRRVDARTASFWLLLLGLTRDECERTSSRPPRPTSWHG